jgi:hypothetical protein
MTQMLKLLCLFIFCAVAFATSGGSTCIGTASCTINKPHPCNPSYTQIAVEPIPTGRPVLEVRKVSKVPSKVSNTDAPLTGKINSKRKVIVRCLVRGCNGLKCYTPIFTLNIDFQTENFLRSICPTTVQNCLCSDVLTQLSGTNNAFSAILSQDIAKNCPAVGAHSGNSPSSSLLEFSNKVLQEAAALEMELESYE